MYVDLLRIALRRRFGGALRGATVLDRDASARIGFADTSGRVQRTVGRRSSKLLTLALVVGLTGCATVSNGLHAVGGLIRDITPKEEGFLNTVGNLSADVHQWGGKVIGDAGRRAEADANTTSGKASETPAPVASAPVASIPEPAASPTPQAVPVTKTKTTHKKEPTGKGGTK